MYLHAIQPGHAYSFKYEYQGETETRIVIFRELSWGMTEWHPELQTFFTGFDVDRKELRSFSLAGIDIKSFSRFTDAQLHNHLNPPPEDEE